MDRGDEEGDRAAEEEQESSSAAAGLACGSAGRPRSAPGHAQEPPRRPGLTHRHLWMSPGSRRQPRCPRPPDPRNRTGSPSRAAPRARAPSPRGRRAPASPCRPACRRTWGHSSNTWPFPTAFQPPAGGEPAPGTPRRSLLSASAGKKFCFQVGGPAPLASPPAQNPPSSAVGPLSPLASPCGFSEGRRHGTPPTSTTTKNQQQPPPPPENPLTCLYLLPQLLPAAPV